jgi:subtilisin family serine protease
VTLSLAAAVTLSLAVAGLAAPAVAAPVTPAYTPPSGAWSQFESDLSGAKGLATGQGVTVAVLSSGADTSVNGLSGKVTKGPEYVFKPKQSLDHSVGTLVSSMIVESPGVIDGLAPDARILSIRTEPDPDAVPSSFSIPVTMTPMRRRPTRRRSGTRRTMAPG